MANANTPLIYGPVEVWYADEATPRPAIDAAVPIAWTHLGVNDAITYSESGVIFSGGGDYTDIFGLGSNQAIDSVLPQDSSTITVPVMEASIALMSLARNVPVVGGSQISLERGITLVYHSLLIRNAQSPEAGVAATSGVRAAAGTQYWAPRVGVVGMGDLTYVKETPVMLELQFRLYRHPTLGVGMLEVKTS